MVTISESELWILRTVFPSECQTIFSELEKIRQNIQQCEAYRGLLEFLVQNEFTTADKFLDGANEYEYGRMLLKWLYSIMGRLTTENLNTLKLFDKLGNDGINFMDLFSPCTGLLFSGVLGVVPVINDIRTPFIKLVEQKKILNILKHQLVTILWRLKGDILKMDSSHEDNIEQYDVVPKSIAGFINSIMNVIECANLNPNPLITLGRAFLIVFFAISDVFQSIAEIDVDMKEEERLRQLEKENEAEMRKCHKTVASKVALYGFTTPCASVDDLLKPYGDELPELTYIWWLLNGVKITINIDMTKISPFIIYQLLSVANKLTTSQFNGLCEVSPNLVNMMCESRKQIVNVNVDEMIIKRYEEYGMYKFIPYCKKIYGYTTQQKTGRGKKSIKKRKTSESASLQEKLLKLFGNEATNFFRYKKKA